MGIQQEMKVFIKRTKMYAQPGSNWKSQWKWHYRLTMPTTPEGVPATMTDGTFGTSCGSMTEVRAILSNLRRYSGEKPELVKEWEG